MNPLRLLCVVVVAAVAPATFLADEPLVPFKAATGWGYRNASGVTVMAPRWAWAEAFHEGTARVATRTSGDSSLLWSYVDKDGNEIARGFAAAGAFVQGRAIVKSGAGDFYFISRAGKRIGSLISGARTELPAPSQAFSRLADYANTVAASQEYELIANPAEGEARLTLRVRALNGGGILVRETGWEGEDVILVLRGHSVDSAKALAAAIFGPRFAKGVPTDAFGPDAAWELAEPEFGAEFVRIRRRVDGVIELVHTIWYS